MSFGRFMLYNHLKCTVQKAQNSSKTCYCRKIEGRIEVKDEEEEVSSY
jgi:hypothetical protein